MRSPFTVNAPIIEQDEYIEQTAHAISALSHPLRLKILNVLSDREMRVRDIVKQVGTTQSNISQHLAVLSERGILASRTPTKQALYRISDTTVLTLIQKMQEIFCGPETRH